jgi:hypothetical protein
VSPTWYDGRAWHGSTAAGAVNSGYTCKDWTSAGSTDIGAAGELDYLNVAWLGTSSGAYTTDACSSYLAVVCVQTAP